MDNDLIKRFYDAYERYNMEGLSYLIDTVHNALDTFCSYSFEQNIMDNLSDAIKQFMASYDKLTLNVDFSAVHEACSKLLTAIEPFSSPQMDLSFLENSITYESDNVIITDDAVASLNEIISENSAEPTSAISSKMSIKEFLISVILPIALFVLQILHDDYHNKLDDIELEALRLQNATLHTQVLDAEYQQLEEERLQTEEIKKQTEYLEQLIHLITTEFSDTPEDSHGFLESAPTAPPQVQCAQPEAGPVPYTIEESFADVEKAPDGFDVHGADE